MRSQSQCHTDNDIKEQRRGSIVLKLPKEEGLRVVTIGAIAFLGITLVLTLHRHFTFYSSYDQGIFNQVFWNGIHGHLFQSSLSSQLSTNVVHSGEVPAVDYHRLGQHFTPALLLWLPLYALFPHPATLTVLQVVLVTAAGLVLYQLGREYLVPKLAALITLSFYGANAILGPTLSNFHDISQIPLYVFTLLLAMEKRWWRLFWLMAGLILLVREDSGITLFGVGFYMVVSRRFPRLGLVVCTLAFSYLLVLTNLIMPIFSEDISKRFMLERFGQYVDAEEATTLEVIWAMISQPWLLVEELVSPPVRTLKYLSGQWLPFAFIPAISPAAWCIAGFPLLKLLLGKGMSVLAISIRYAMSVVPGLCYGTILWWSGQGFRNFLTPPEALPPRKPSTRFRAFWLGCIILSLIFTITSNPSRTLYFVIPDSIQPWVYVHLPQQWQRVGQIRPLLAQIPPSASVSATTYLIPHLSGRREIVRLPGLALRNDAGEVINVDYAIADLWRLREYQIAFDEDRELAQTLVNLIDAVTQQQQYGIIGCNNGIVLLQKGVPSDPEALAQWSIFRPTLAPAEPTVHRFHPQPVASGSLTPHLFSEKFNQG